MATSTQHEVRYTSTIDAYRSHGELNFSSIVYKIPILGVHICNRNMCGFLLENGSELIPNPHYINGKCQFSGKLSENSVYIHDFDALIPQVYDNEPLYNPDMKVIHTDDFSICIDFPLGNPVDVQIRKPEFSGIATKSGYTLREVLQLISHIYQHIYETEESTATEQSIRCKRACDCVSNPSTELMSVMESAEAPSEEQLREHCGICYNAFDADYYTLECKHVFHKKCIEAWIITGNGTSCPFCRSMICTCSACGNSKVVQYIWRGKILPLRERANGYRNMTNGKYRIFNHDLETLVLKSMYYNQKLKRLRIIVCRDMYLF